jgi:hypothetical protein
MPFSQRCLISVACRPSHGLTVKRLSAGYGFLPLVIPQAARQSGRRKPGCPVKFRRHLIWCYPPAGLFDSRHTVKTRLNLTNFTSVGMCRGVRQCSPVYGNGCIKSKIMFLLLLLNLVLHRLIRFSEASVEQCSGGLIFFHCMPSLSLSQRAGNASPQEVAMP